MSSPHGVSACHTFIPSSVHCQFHSSWYLRHSAFEFLQDKIDEPLKADHFLLNDLGAYRTWMWIRGKMVISHGKLKHLNAFEQQHCLTIELYGEHWAQFKEFLMKNYLYFGFDPASAQYVIDILEIVHRQILRHLWQETQVCMLYSPMQVFVMFLCR